MNTAVASRWTIPALTFLSALLAPLSVEAAPGGVDTNFNANVTGNYVLAVAMQPDGKILLGGGFANANGQAHTNVARFNVDGSVEGTNTFNPGTGPNSDVYSLAVQADGKILLVGFFTSVNGQVCNRIARLNADGTVEGTNTFNPGTGPNSDVYSLAVQADGKILLVGFFTSVNGQVRNRIARLNADGTVEGTNTFNPGTGADDSVTSVAVQADGKILLVGFFTSVNGQVRNRIARLNADGTVEGTNTFNPGTGANASVLSVAIQADGRILLGGIFTAMNGQPRNYIARLNADGSVESTNTFNPGTGASNYITSLAVQADGKILLGGAFTGVNGQPRNHIARLNADGTVEGTNTFNPGLGLAANATVLGVAIQADGKILVGGQFTSVNGQPHTNLARLFNDVTTQSFTTPTSARVQWLRGGAAPEIEQATFELSTNGGGSWSLLGPGTRIAGGWERTGLSLPASGSIRARGRTTGGYENGSSGLAQAVAAFAPPPPPSATTLPATAIAETNATLNGIVNPNASATIAWFDWGTTTNYGNQTPFTFVGNGTVSNLFSAIVSNLAPFQVYHFRLAASNTAGLAFGTDQIFTTSDTVPPVIISCPSNIIACQGSSNLGVMPDLIGQVVATDNSASQLVITQNPLPATLVSGGNVIFTVTDGAGNSTTCTNVISVQPCPVTPPPGLVLWLSFDELAGFTTFNAAGGNNGTLLNGVTSIGSGYVGRSLCFDGVNDYVNVPSYPAINPGTNDFTLAAWVNRDSSSGNSPRIIVDKRDTNTIGYSLSLSFGNLLMQLATPAGNFTNYRNTRVVPADNQWHFVAVTIDRTSTNGGRFYVDGLPTGTFDPTGHPGNINNNGSFSVGSTPLAGYSPWMGCIDEVEMFRRALSATEITSLYNALLMGICLSSCKVPWDTMICPGQTNVVVTARICNSAPFPQTYNYSFYGLPVGPHGSFPGPTFFSPAGGSVTVEPNSCVSFPVSVGVPAGMPCNTNACYEMVISPPVGTTELFACDGSLWKPCASICVRPVTNTVSVTVGRSNLLSFTLTSSSAAAIDLSGTRISVLGPDMLPDAQFVSLNGLPPAVPWEVPPGLTLPPNGQITLSVNAQFLNYSSLTVFTILLEADTDGDGEFEPLASMELVNVIGTNDNLLTIARGPNGSVVLQWSAEGWILQEVSSLAPPWTDTSATSPYTIIPLPGSAKYFRLKQAP